MRCVLFCFFEHEELSVLDGCLRGDISSLKSLCSVGEGKLEDLDFVFSGLDSSSFYMTNPIARSSSVLRECASLAKDCASFRDVAAE